MFTRKIALLSAASLLCAGLAMAQPPADAPPPPMVAHDHHVDVATLHKNLCEDHQAHTAAKLAYVEVKLGLTDAQKPLFAKWRQAVLDSAGKEKATCLAMTPKTDAKMPTILDREAHEEAMLQARLDLLKSSRPALQAFYDSLSDAQKESFNRLHEEHGHGHHGGDGETFMHHPQ